MLYDNVVPLSISSEFNLDDSNTFHNPDNPSETNTYNGIFTAENFNDNISWGETEVAYVIDGGLWVTGSHTLTLSNNVVLKFKSSSELILDTGIGNLPGYNGTGVYFTSYKDDTIKGDTNGDGSATTPANNDWTGIYDNSMTIPSPWYYTWGNIYYDSY